MEQLEKVEKLREKTGVTYETAKKALEENNWDMLDAIVALENQGKIVKPQMPTYSTGPQSSSGFTNTAQNYEEECTSTTLGEMMDKFFKWCGKMIKKGCDNYFEVRKDGKLIISAPIIILVILLVVAFWVTLPLMVIGLFCGFKYSFCGNMKVTLDLNEACDKAAETCENIKNDFTGKKGES